MRFTLRISVLATVMMCALAPAVAGTAALASAKSAAAGGTTLWLARYHGTPAASAGYAQAVAVSPDGSRVFVTGSTTVGYDAGTGKQLWAAPAPSGSQFVAADVVVSPDGSTVFVTGTEPTASGTSQYLTIAYDAATGAQLWQAAYQGLEVGEDSARKIAVSPDGSEVFVTGQSNNTTNPDEYDNAYATVAYNTSNGAQLWADRYTDGGNAGATWIAVSPDGTQVYVTGASAASSGLYSYATLAYSAVSGTTVWARRYNQAGHDASAVSGAVSPDGTGIYVTGSAHGPKGQDYTTLAYTASGALQWVAHYSSSGGGDSAQGMTISKDGSELVVAGQARILPGGHYIYATVAYRARSGAQLWARLYSGPGDFGLPASVAMSPDGSTAFVTGYVAAVPGNGNIQEYGTVAYNAATGARLWARTYGGPVAGNDKATGIAVSPDGSSVFVTGGSPGKSGIDDYATLAYQAGAA